MHLLDPSLFTADWFISTQLSTFSIRTYFVYLLWGPSSLFSPPVAVGALYLVCWFAIASGLYVLGVHLFYSKMGAILGVAICLVFTPFWTLGGNDLIHSMLVPSMLGWGLGIWSLVFFTRFNFKVSAILLGLATLFQALVGLQLSLLLGLILFIKACSKSEHGFKEFIVFSGLFLLFASPSLIPLFYQQLGPSSGIASNTESSLFYIMASFRSPHHHLFNSFDITRTIQFIALAVAGAAGLLLHYTRRKTHPIPFFFILSAFGIITLICTFAYIGTEVYSNLTITKLQLFKFTVVAKFLFILIATSASVAVLPKGFISSVEAFLFNTPWKFLLIYIPLYAVLIFGQTGRFQSKIFPLSTAVDDKYEVYEWFKAHTSVDAIVATPPSWSGFRSYAQRSIVINHKSFPYNDIDIHHWFDRLTSMAPIEQQPRTDRTLMSKLDDAYEQASKGQLKANIDRFNIDYLVRSTRLDTSYTPLFSTERWYIYKSERLDGPEEQEAP